MRRAPLRGSGFAGLGLCLLLLLGGCATAPRLAPERVAALPAIIELTETPFFAQEEHYCGPASLAMVMSARGLPAAQRDLAASVYLPARKGSLPLDMLGGARRWGAVAMRLEPRLEAVFDHVAAGYPVVVLQNLALPWYPMWHYAVVVGYDLPAQTLILRSGDEARQVISAATFDATWSRSGRWAMVAFKPGDIPPSADLTRYTEATLALERLRHHREALAAYRAGTARWPQAITLAMGVGNTAYALGDLGAAESAFRDAAAAHPDADAPLNNLAHVLAQRGDIDAAAGAARRAIALNGPNAEIARATLVEIEAKRPSPAMQ